MTKQYSMQIKSENPPIVELDSEAHAAYVRFSNRAVAKTVPLMTKGCVVTADYDSKGEIIGVELIGVKEFGIEPMLEAAGICPLPESLASRAKYIPASRREMAAA